jgi:transposase-like protein
MEAIRHKACSNPACENRGQLDAGNIILYASFNTKCGARKRYICKTCGLTFSANTGTAYFGLRCSREEFDQVARMRVEGMSISAIARVACRSRNTITRWLERAAASAKRFNDQHLWKFEIKEFPTVDRAPARALIYQMVKEICGVDGVVERERRLLRKLADAWGLIS